MATDDQSHATIIENDMLTKIAAVALTTVDTYEHYPGSFADVAQGTLEESLSTFKFATVQVAYAGSRYEHVSGAEREELDRVTTYHVYIAVRNEASTGAKARTGDGTIIGVLGIRDKVITALHGVFPPFTTFPYGPYMYRSDAVTWGRKGFWALVMEIELRETPKYT